MEKAKRYYWMKLKVTYFDQLVQKKMKRQQNGRDMQVIYLRMLLCSLEKDGYIHYQGVYESLEEELAEEFDEPVELVQQTIQFMVDNNMVSIDEESNYFLPEAIACTGSESYSAERMRKLREKRKMSQCDASVINSDASVTSGDEEKELELEKELETEKDTIISPEPDKPAPVGSGILIPLVDGTYYDVPVEKIAMWGKAYPAVDVEQEFHKMIAWCDANPNKRKTARGVARFINSWLEREQDSGRSSRQGNDWNRQQITQNGGGSSERGENRQYYPRSVEDILQGM
jgi:predicted phage replisome organizer